MTPMAPLNVESPDGVGLEQLLAAEGQVEVVEVAGDGRRVQAQVQLQK